MAAFSPFFLSLLFFFLVLVWVCWWLSSDNGRHLLLKIFFLVFGVLSVSGTRGKILRIINLVQLHIL